MAANKALCVLLCCAVAFLALSCAKAESDAKVSPEAGALATTMPHPAGSGLNTPISLGRKPRYGRRYMTLMKQFVNAARAGNMDLVQQLQQQLFTITKPKHHRRQLLQPATDACPAIPGSELIVNATGQPTSGAEVASFPVPPGPLPSIRFFTLEPCAEFGCRRQYTLVRQRDGSITCRGPLNSPTGPTVSPIEVEDFAYFLVFDYEFFWDTDGSNVIGGAYAGNTITNKNEWATKRGSLSAQSNIGSSSKMRLQPNPAVGFRADADLVGEVKSGVEVSRKVGEEATLQFRTTLPELSAEGVYNSVLPGTAVSERSGDPSDDNVVFRTNNPALFGFFGKKH